MANVFLSYAQEDLPRAKMVAGLLESCGWSVFWDTHIKPAADWRQVLQSELDSAGAVVVLWSLHSVNSTWVHEEAERGRTRVVAVRIDDVALPLGFSRLQAINLIGWRGGRVEAVDQLVDAVAETLRTPPPRRPVVPKSPFQKLRVPVAVGLCAALLAMYPVARWLRRPAPIMNQQIVLDASQGMSAPFEGAASKMEAAVQAIRARTLHPSENLSLRGFGGECHQDDATRLLVPFGTGRRERILRATGSLRPRGEPTLVSAVISALADLQPLLHTKRVIVLTGHADACQKEAVNEIKQHVDAYAANGRPIALEMRFIGLAMSAADQAQVRMMSDEVGGRAYFVDTVAELNDVLDYVLEFEPAVTHVRAVWDVVGAVGQSINDFAAAMNGRRFDEAQKILDAGRESYARVKPSFDALAGQSPSAEFQRFYALAAENRTLQEQAFEVGEAAIEHGKPEGESETPAYAELVKVWNERLAKYNANITEMNRLTDQIVNEARKRGAA